MEGQSNMQRNSTLIASKTHSGRTLLARKPVPDLDHRPPAFSKSGQDLLRLAATYAEFSQDQAIYQYDAVGSGQNPFQHAMADYLGRPQILGIGISQWTGKAGQTILIGARDNYVVLSVRLLICNSHTILEAGEAVQSEKDAVLWRYTTTTPIARRPGIRFEAFAYDLPGNAGGLSLKIT